MPGKVQHVMEGGQTSHIVCGCGFIIHGSIRDANYRFKLHKVKCINGQNSEVSELNLKTKTKLHNSDITNYLNIDEFKNNIKNKI